MSAFKLIVWFIILLIIVIFTVQNMQSVELKYYDANFELQTTTTPLIVIMLGSLFSGILLASVFSMVNNIRLKRTIRQQNQTINSLDKQVAELSIKQTQPPEEQKLNA